MLRGPDARLRLISVVLVALLLPVVVQLVRFQVLEHATYQAQVTELVERQFALPDPPWGCIWDRNGDLLVGNVPVYDLGAEVGLVSDPAAAAAELAPLLNRPVEALTTDLTLRPDEKDLPIVWRAIAQQVPSEVISQTRALGYAWLTYTPTWVRYYAEGTLAAHLLGFVNQDGFGYGVQAYQLRFLKGERVRNYGLVDANSSPLPVELVNEQGLPYPGTDLRLTLDRTLQAYVEGELDKALLEYSAKGGIILVMNPRTGAILAVASRPTYEPSRYPEYALAGQESLFQDPAVSQAYEPGSVFKLITAAAALDSGRVDLNWSYQDTGALEYGGVTVYNWNRGAYGQQDLEGILSHSLNVGVATLSTRVLGEDEFYRYVRAFGFGQATGVELAGEATGLVHTPADWDWTDSHLATNSFGQGIAITPIQLVAAVAAIANDGVMMQPTIVAERLYPDGQSVIIPPRPLGQPISAETARVLSELMARAVERESHQAQIPGYRIAGKTGTAQIPGPGGYDRNDVITSFIGFGPLPDPQMLVFIRLDRPGIDPNLRWGTQTAAPLFQKIAGRLFVLLGIPPSDLAAQ